jgi:SAM-dependent methyltransferase
MTKGCELLLDAATRPYRPCGRFPWHFARGKLRHDPFFFSIVRRGILPDAGRLLDVGCGQGLLLALIAAGRQEYRLGRWPQTWPAPPRELELRGIELEPRRVRIARRALEVLDAGVRIDCADARDATFPPSSVIAFVDVLLYLNRDEQQRVLRKAVDALTANGLLILREADDRPDVRFQITRLTERLCLAMRGRFRQQLHQRATDEWRGLLEGLGLTVEVEPMSAGTPFSNMLFVARLPALGTDS